MKVVVENKIPFLADWLDSLGGVEVTSLPPDEINRATVSQCDALMVRTRTRCDAALLQESKVKFIGTATIGTDHIDLEWCRKAGITVANAPGCNAPAVAQWVIAAADLINGHRPLQGMTLGVVGVGNVGSIVARYARCCGMDVLECDPPKGYPLTLEETAGRADILTFHTPLTIGGPYPTRHLFDSRIASMMKQGATVLNAARGAVTDTAALVGALESGHLHAAIDCWENEPRISARLLELARVATPHIAGYSAQGKLRGSLMVARAFMAHFGISGRLPVEMPQIAPEITQRQAALSYDIEADTRSLRSGGAAAFEHLRNNYRFRQEINHLQ